MKKRMILLRSLALGSIGILALLALAEVPGNLPRIALAVNPLALLLILGALGAWTAQDAGLRSAVLLGDSIDLSALKRVLGLSAAVGVVIALGDHLTRDLWRPAGAELPLSLAQAAGWKNLLLGITYGGITEELMLRWGVVSGIMLGMMRFLPRTAAGIVAIAIASLLFAVGHLPAVIAAGVQLDAALLTRILVLNAGLGAWFGWLYLRHNLEAAITAHAGFHIGAFALGMVFV